MQKTLRSHLLSCAVLSTATVLAAPVVAQEADEEAVQEKIVVTGSRGQPRSVTDSPVPIDVLSEEEITAVPFTDTNDILRTLVPSYTLSRQPISDGASFIRPASMRGLPTDKTLVLVNSKRRHRASLVSIGGSGTQGPDIATIPAIALKNIEVLRDGAAAQYGSDAIAGVINFILKDSPDGGSISLDFGQHYEGDGFGYNISGNAGIALGDNGFLNLSAELSEADATVRSVPYCESWACTDPTDPRFAGGGSSFDTSIAGYSEETYLAGLADANIGPGDVVQPWGQPNVNAFRTFFNAGYDFGAFEAYSFGNYSQSDSDGGFFYRYPGNGTIENIRLEDGSVWSPLFLFPGGFTPRFSGNIIDYSGVAGIKGETEGGFSWDLSGRFGHNEIKYTLENTVNPSLGDQSPTKFRPGDLINEEIQLQADFAQSFETGLAGPLVLAFGASYLDETYELVEGGESSYIAGPYAGADPWGFCDGATPTAAGAAVIANGSTLDCADGDDPINTVVGVGSNGFPGYSPEFSEEYTRDSFGIYGDLSADITDKLFLQGAVRFEDYSDFDSELVWKLAGIYDLTDSVSIRGSVGTGFRAPTPGQQGTTNVSTRLPNGFPVATGLFPAGGDIAGALGATPLEPETSTNYTLGLTAGTGNLTFTLDFYQIDLEDRINAISTQDVSPSEPDPMDFDDGVDDDDYIDALNAYNNYLALVGAGVVGAESIGGVFYFTNAFDTKTQGFDAVLTYSMDWAGGASTMFSGSFNWNETTLEGEVSQFFNNEAQFDFENGDPEWRSVLTAVHETGPVTLLARANIYGPHENSNGGSGPVDRIQEFDTEVLIDLEASFRATDNVTLSVGARNIFDEYPAEGNNGETCCGRIYRSDSIVDWQGGYYYAKAVANF